MQILSTIDKIVTKILRTFIVLAAISGLMWVGTVYYHSVKKTITIPIQGEILPGSLDWDTFLVTYLADSNTTLIFDINSPGGVTLEAVKLENAIQLSPAISFAKIHKMAASAAADIALSCDGMEADKGSIILFHQSFILLPDYNKYIDNDDVLSVYSDTLVKHKLFPLLTQEQQDTYSSGQNLILSAPALSFRFMMQDFANMIKYSLNNNHPHIYHPAFYGPNDPFPMKAAPKPDNVVKPTSPTTTTAPPTNGGK